MQRAVKVAYWALPSLFCLLLYWYGFRSWFQQDDFAWLGLFQQVHDFKSFLWATFAPLAQGTIRPFSERLFFMTLMTTFGMDALPFRIVIFATAFFDLVMLCLLTNRLAGSRIAGFTAAILWTSNAALSIPLSWVSAYNEVLCAGFLLLATYLFVRYTQTDNRRYYWWQWLVFVFGFGALEINVVYPAIVALYALCCARRYFKSTLPMFAVSALYAYIHRSVAPPQASSVYRLYFDSQIWTTLWTYVKWAVGADRFAAGQGLREGPFLAAEAIVWAGIVLVLVWMIRRRAWIALFFLGWFFGVLAPVVPLKNHLTDYYLVIPAIGLAMLGGWAVAEVWRMPQLWARAVAVAIALVYLLPSAWAGRKQARYNFDASRHVKSFVQSVAYAHKLHPDKLLVIRGIDSHLFWTGFYGNPFRIFGVRQIYLTEDNRKSIEEHPELAQISGYFIPDSIVYSELKQDRAVVYQFAGARLRNISQEYRERLAQSADLALSPIVRPGVPAFESQLGEGWYPIESNYRWMKKRGVVRLRGPQKPNDMLAVSGHCPELQMQKGPLHMTVAIDGHVIGRSEINRSNLGFTFRYPLPSESAGKSQIEVSLEVDRTVSTATDNRTLGVVITDVEIVE